MIIEVEVERVHIGTVYIEVPDGVTIEDARCGEIATLLENVAKRDAKTWSSMDFDEPDYNIGTVNVCNDEHPYDVIDDYEERDEIERLVEKKINSTYDPNQTLMDFMK